MTTKPGRDLTLKDKLSRLDHTQVRQMLGIGADRLLARGGRLDIDIDSQVRMTDQFFRVTFAEVRVEIRLSDSARRRLQLFCSACQRPCIHLGAVLSLILEEKMALGLSRLPDERPILGALSEDRLLALALEERRRKAEEEQMRVVSSDSDVPWTDYTVANRSSGRTYRVAMRGLRPGESFCSCPDFRKSRLGTCKHIMRVERSLRDRFSARKLAVPYRRRTFSVHVDYADTRSLLLKTPDQMTDAQAAVVAPLVHQPVEDVDALLKCLRRLEVMGASVIVYPDAEEMIQSRLLKERLSSSVAGIRRDPAAHPLRKTLLKTELLPYQLDGIAFAAGAGRSVLADDMGLGKTIQGIGLALFLQQECDIEKVLIVCPASLKAQWRNEIIRFSGRDCTLVAGSTRDRVGQYRDSALFTICNYEQVLKDILTIEQTRWDLIILDEGQRIKNWEAKTTRVIKRLHSRFALVLTGTPLENRLDDLFSIVEFIDDNRLGPAFRFFNRHRMVNEKGKVIGYEGLDELRERLKPILLRRTRDLVMKQLPPRTTEIIRVEPTQEQIELHAAHMRTVNAIIRKKYLTEMDILRLQKALLMCRMAADSTLLVDGEEPGASSKLQQLEDLLRALSREEHRKIVLFSEWTTMLDLIEPVLHRNGLRFVRLDGSVPQKKRQGLVNEFQGDPDCRVFITTNAGSTGLNLQAANTVINVDLPWNPAVLEQRISRAHRMGQTSPVMIFILITEGTLEENLLTTLSAKHQLALAALDIQSGVDSVHIESGMEELKRRLEVLLGAGADAPLAVGEARRVEGDVRELTERRERLAAAGGQMLQSALAFLGEMLPGMADDSPLTNQIAQQLKDGLMECVDRDENGRPRLTVTFTDLSALESLARTLARCLPPI